MATLAVALTVPSVNAATIVKLRTALPGMLSQPSYTPQVGGSSVRVSMSAPASNTSIYATTQPVAPAGEITSGRGNREQNLGDSDSGSKPRPNRTRSKNENSDGGHQTAQIAPYNQGSKSGAKGGMEAPPELTFEDPGKLRFIVEAGYNSQLVWRGIDVAQFTSYNHWRPVSGPGGGPPPANVPASILPKVDSDVAFIAFTTTFHGFAFGAKYIETIDDQFNPFYAPLATTTDSYQELVLSVNYTRMLVGEDLLQGTAGFDFYIYPNGEFWGVDHQGMVYLRLSSPHFKWAQPFAEVFYNIATDTSGNGLAAKSTNPRGVSGSDLVEGGGVEFGVSGGDRVAGNDSISVAFDYSLSAIYKTGYSFEQDGFSHVVASIGLPVTFGGNFTITPSVSYSHALQDIDDSPGLPGTGRLDSAWNEPGWSAGVKASFQF